MTFERKHTTYEKFLMDIQKAMNKTNFNQFINSETKETYANQVKQIDVTEIKVKWWFVIYFVWYCCKLYLIVWITVCVEFLGFKCFWKTSSLKTLIFVSFVCEKEGKCKKNINKKQTKSIYK